MRGAGAGPSISADKQKRGRHFAVGTLWEGSCGHVATPPSIAGRATKPMLVVAWPIKEDGIKDDGGN